MSTTHLTNDKIIMLVEFSKTFRKRLVSDDTAKLNLWANSSFFLELEITATLLHSGTGLINNLFRKK
jgi:hypothetical protein